MDVIRKTKITVLALISAQGKANGNLEYSSTIVNIYLFLELVGNEPLKSIFSLSNGRVDRLDRVYRFMKIWF